MVLHPMILDYLHLNLYQKNRRKSGNISNNYRAILMKYMNRTDISSPVLDIDDINYMLTTLCTE